MVLQCINGVGSNPVEGRTKNLTALKSNSNTVWFNFQTYIYIYVYIIKKSFFLNQRIILFLKWIVTNKIAHANAKRLWSEI
jgi:hypothetical protein